MSDKDVKEIERVFKPKEDFIYVLKLYAVNYVFLTIFLVILGRLFYLQVIEGHKYELLSLNNRQQLVQIPSPRGRIFVDDGKTIIARNQKSFSLYFDPRTFPYQDKEAGFMIIDQASKQLGVDPNEFLETVNKRRRYQYRTFLLKPNVSFKTVAYLAEHFEEFPGISYESTPLREYPEGRLYSHILGYINKITPKQYQERKNLGYSSDSFLGVMGVEGRYDLELRGQDGKKVKIIDSKNRVVDEYTLPDGKAVPGGDAILTIDSRVQNILKRVMDGYTGAAIVSQTSTGEILGLYSYPNFNPNIFINPGDHAQEIQKNRENSENPYLNRTIQGLYPPASTFKIVMAAAALKNGVNANDRFQCNGSIMVGDRKFRGLGTTQKVEMTHAIAYSCDVFFYTVGLKIGVTAIGSMAKQFNLGNLTGIDLLYEKAGRVPTQRWKNERYGAFWWDGDTANLSIGQGYLLTTPLQMNTVISAIANGGVVYRPHILKRILAPEGGGVLFESKRDPIVNLLLSNSEIDLIRRGLRGAATIGTAAAASDSPLLIRGKTGTAQNEGAKNHGWFISYVPYQDGNLAVTVFIEHGLGGAILAAPFSTAIEEAVILGRDPHEVFIRLAKDRKHQDVYEDWLCIKGYKKCSLPKKG